MRIYEQVPELFLIENVDPKQDSQIQDGSLILMDNGTLMSNELLTHTEVTLV